jgi:CBS domain-containing protein
MLAKDIMRSKVVTIDRYQTVQELAQLLQDRCITGVPVVDENGAVLGVVSQTDLVRTRREAGGVPSFHVEADMPLSASGMHFEEMDGTRVEAIMTPGAIAFDESTPVEAIAKSMIELHIHRVLVTRADKLCGIVSSMDMLKALLPARKSVSAGGRASRAHGTRRRSAARSRGS